MSEKDSSGEDGTNSKITIAIIGAVGAVLVAFVGIIPEIRQAPVQTETNQPPTELESKEQLDSSEEPVSELPPEPEPPQPEESPETIIVDRSPQVEEQQQPEESEPVEVIPTPQVQTYLLASPSSAKDYGTQKVNCSLTDKTMSMDMVERAGGYSMCCADYDPPALVKVGDKVTTTVFLESGESQLDLKVETLNDEHIHLNQTSVEAGQFYDELLFSTNDFSDRQEASITRFCVAAIGPGALQKITTNFDLLQIN